MKRTFALIIVLIAAFPAVSQNRFPITLASGTVVTQQNAAGLDKPYEFDVPALTPDPYGYEPQFIEHYGRHGSRYAYSHSFYRSLAEALDTARVKGILTPFGKDLYDRYMPHYEFYMQRMGDLSDIGWEQQQRIAETMYLSFPSAFIGGADVFATASSSTRSIMSMSAFCLGMCHVDPTLKIREEQSSIYLGGTNPRDGRNPFSIERKPNPFPFDESLDAFELRRVDCDRILSRLFTDIPAACAGMDRVLLIRDLYVLVSGMNSVPQEHRTDFSGLFTDEEYALMWEVDNYQRYGEYVPYVPMCIPVSENMIEDAMDRMAKGTRGATVRFGHDHVMMPVLMFLGINGFERLPQSPDEVAACFTTWDSPMATNLQMVFYRPVNGDGEYLVKILLNGVEAKIPVAAVSGPYYRWSDLKAWYDSRLALFPPEE